MAKKFRNLAAVLREFEAAGCPTLLGEDLDLGPQLRASAVGGMTENTVFDVGVMMGCIIDLEIVNQLSTPVYVTEIELDCPWGPHPRFRWLSEGDLVMNQYHFPGTALQYPRCESLNHWLATGARIGPRDRKAGLL